MNLYYKKLKKIGITICGTWLLAGSLHTQPMFGDTTSLLKQIGDAQQIEANEPEVAKAIYRNVKTQSEKIGWPTGVLKYYANYTAVLNQQGRYDSALQLNLEALALAKKHNNSQYILASLMNTGTSYFYLNNAPAAIEYYFQALPLLNPTKNPNSSGILFDNLGNAYDAIRDFKSAKKYYQQALGFYRQTADTIGLCYTSNNLAKTFTALEQYDSAYALVQEGIKLATETKKDYLSLIFQLNLTNIYMHKGQYDSMLSPGHAAITLSRRLNDDGSMANAGYALAWSSLFANRTDSANFYARIGLTAAERSGSKKEQSELFALLSQIALYTGNLTAFDDYNKKSNALADSVLNNNIQRSSLALAASYEANKKQATILALEKSTRVSRTWNIMLVGIITLMVLAGWLGWRNVKQRQRLAAKEDRIQKARILQMEQEKQLLAGQSLLRGQEEERTRLSRELHDGIGSMLSGIKFSLGAMKGNMVLAEKDAQLFTGTLQKLDETIAEMRRVAHSMMPEALLRLGLDAAISDYCDSLQASGKVMVRYQPFGMDKRLPNDVEIVVYRIVQELFTNVIKHAEATEIILQIMQHDGMLSLTFEDNGVGMTVGDNFGIAGAGLKNIRARVEYLRGQFDLRSTVGKGTSAHIEIPLS